MRPRPLPRVPGGKDGFLAADASSVDVDYEEAARRILTVASNLEIYNKARSENHKA